MTVSLRTINASTWFPICGALDIPSPLIQQFEIVDGRRGLAVYVANERDVEDGVIWVHGIGHIRLMAFTDFGIDNLVDLLKVHTSDPRS